MDEPFAAAPRAAGLLAAPDGDGTVDLDDQWGTIRAAALAGELDAGRCQRLEVEASELKAVSVVGGPELELDVRASELLDCDLAGVRLRAVMNTRLVGCKLSGADLTNAILRDVVFERCLLRMTSVRMAELERVAFGDCTLDEVDLYDTALAEVTFAGSVLTKVDADQARFHHVDLRGAKTLDFRSCSRLAGCLLSPEQVVEVAFTLARIAGASIEREPQLDADILQS